MFSAAFALWGRRRVPPAGRWLLVCITTVYLCAGSTVLAQRESKARTPRLAPKRHEHKTRARGWEHVSREGLSSAAESAREDAMEQLARRVEAFVTTSRAIADGLRKPFAGVTFSPPRFSPDQICIVRARVSVEDVIRQLKLLNRRHGTGQFNDRDWDRIRSLNRGDTITAVGQGVPALAHISPRRERAWGNPPSWTGGIHRATGVGRQPASRRGTPAGKLIAARRAMAEARRKLAEQLRALPLGGTGSVTVGNEIDRRPDLVGRFSEWVNNTRIVDTRWRASGEAVVKVEADLASLWALVAPHRTMLRPSSPRRFPVTRPREHKNKARSRP